MQATSPTGLRATHLYEPSSSGNTPAIDSAYWPDAGLELS